MIRTTDAMLKSVQVQKIKERIADIEKSIVRAKAAHRFEIVEIFHAALQTERSNLDYAYELLKNPAA
jgi:hypothetical protein